MNFWYQLINFLLLAGVLVLVGRKMVLRIFRSRRERINRELDEAEAGALRVGESENLLSARQAENAAALSAFSAEETARLETRLAGKEARLSGELTEISASVESGLAGERLAAAARVRRRILAQITEALTRCLPGEPYVARMRERARTALGEILTRIRVTSGDRAYLMQHDVLYVTLKSAEPLEDELVRLTEKTVADLVSGVGGKISFWYQVDAHLLGGLRLKVGDTVYDSSLKNALYRMNVKLRETPADESLEPDALLQELRESLSEGFPSVDVYQRGRVVSVSDGICWLDGLADIMYGELVEFENGEQGMVLDIEESRIGCVIFGEYQHIRQYSYVRRLEKMAGVPVGEELLGAVIGPLGTPLDGRATLRCREYRPIECPAPAIIDRQSVSQPLYTGIKAIDALVPIGKGQRELIIGDRQTGKTAIAVDAIINQADKNVICIYVAIGQKETTVAGVVDRLRRAGAMRYTVVVCADASASAPLQYIAPNAGTAIGEYFMEKGRDVLIVYDDLSKHAVAYREMSLLLHRPSGREAYPGDVFYLHSRLLERSARLSDEKGGGSMTALPIIETQAGDISAYIPTNVISITDGQIFLESELFHKGQRPAVNVGLSVSRVGGAAQTRAMRQVSGRLRMDLAQYRELEAFSQFGAELDESTKAALARGARMTAALRQKQYSPLSSEQQILTLFSVSEGFADGIQPEDVGAFETALLAFFDREHRDLLERIARGDRMDEELLETLRSILRRFTEEYVCRVSGS